MNRPHKNTQTRTTIALVLLAVLTLSGCGFYKKMQANKKNGEVEAGVGEVQAQQAQRYLPQDFERLSRTLDEAKNAVNTGEYDLALQSGDNALAQIDQIRSRLPQAKAIVEEKKAALVDLHTRITDVVEEVKILGPDETELVEKVSEVDAFIDQVQNAVVQVVEGEQGYDAALLRAKAVLDEATVTLVQLEQESAQALAENIDQAWTEALNLEVMKHIPEATEVPEQIERAKAAISSGSYRVVLDQFSSLPKQIERYRDRAREKRAATRIARADRLIQLAETDPDASLDAIESAKSTYRDAGNALQEGNYDSAFNLAETAIEVARQEVKGIEEDLRGQVEELEARIEKSLDWETAQTASELYNEAVAYLAAAKENLADILFDDCQDAIDRGAQVIEDAIAEARIAGLTQRIADDEKALLATQDIGAFQHLREEYQAIQEELATAEKQVSRASFDEAEGTLTKIEERIAGLETSLRDLAQNRLAAAEAAHQEAVEARAEDHAPDLLEEAAGLIESARSAAASAIWKDAIENAEQSQSKAQEAAQQAYKIRTEQLRPTANEELELAKQSGASNYAAELYNKALTADNNSKVAYEEEHYRTALEELSKAKDLAGKARVHQIDVAQEKVDSAIAAKADEYEAELIGNALANLSEARAKMAEQDFGAASQSAVSAISQAEEAETSTWRKRSTAALADLTAAVSTANENRAPTYAEAEFKKVSITLEEAQGYQSSEDFKEAFHAADRGAQEIEEVNARLTDEARLVRGDYDRLVGELKTYVEDEFGRGLHLQATERLGKIDDAILRNNFRLTFDLYEEGVREAQNQIVAVKIHNLNAQKEKLGQKISKAEAAGLFQFVDRTSADVVAEMEKVQYDPVLDRLKEDVDYYTECVRGLASVEAEMDRLEEDALSNVETRVERVRTDIDNAGKIGARDLIPTVFDSAIDNYEKTEGMLYLIRNPMPEEEEVSFNDLSQQLSQAEGQATQLNQAAIVKNSSVNYLRDLIFWTFDMTRYLDQWYPIEELGYEMILTADSSAQVDAYREMQVALSVRKLLHESERLYKRIKPLTPPDPQADVHALALSSFEMFVRCADGFYRYGQYGRYPKRTRERYLAKAFVDLERLHQLNDRLLLAIIQEVKGYDMVNFEREFSDEFNAFKAYLRRDKTSR